MKSVRVRVPLRVDLAGGTLDLWPIYLFHPGARTVNAAISIHAECDVEEIEAGIEIRHTDRDFCRQYASIDEVAADPDVPLAAVALRHFGVERIRITTRTDAPRGSGLGGSSAIAIALVRGLSHIIDAPVEGEALIALVRDLETRLIGSPAGIQDYYPPVFGGTAALELEPGRIIRRPIPVDASRLARNLVVHYSGVSHFSGTNNWEIYKRQIDGDEAVRAGLGEISRIAHAMEESLLEGDLEAAGRLLGQEWAARKRLIDGVSTPEVDQIVKIAGREGAWGAKVCGAGGGGCVVILVPEDRRDRLVSALRSAPGMTLDAAPVAHGLDLDSGPLRSARRSGGADGIDHRRLASETETEGALQPWVVVETSVIYQEPRKDLRMELARAWLAPLEDDRSAIAWDRGFRIEPGSLEALTVPAEHDDVTLPDAGTIETSLHGFLRENERLHLYWNRHLNLSSRPGEGRDAFIERCLRRSENLADPSVFDGESTLRRKVDQLKERAEREFRQAIASEEETPEIRARQIDLSWGQVVNDIAQGRFDPSDLPSEVEFDNYADALRRLQKNWEKEIAEIRDEALARARDIEPILLTPTERAIELESLWILRLSRASVARLAAHDDPAAQPA